MEKTENNPAKKRLYWGYLFLVLLVRLLLVSGLRVWAVADDRYDDGLMITLASKLMKYRWLGEYNQGTLVKGVTFPFYLMILNKLGLPFVFANVLLCFAACLAFITAAGRFIRSRAVLCGIFTLLMFNPLTSASWTLNRVYRDSIYSQIVLLLFAFVIELFAGRSGSARRYCVYAAAAGLMLAAVWHVREDSAWVLPFVLAALIVTALFIVFDKGLPKKALRLAATAAVPGILVLSILAVCTVNYLSYGIFVQNTLMGGSLPRLVKDLSCIKPDEFLPQVPVPASTRQKAYAVSPAFQKVEPVLEGHGFVKIAHQNPHCQMLVWALMDSVYTMGDKSARASQAFYKQSAVEIEQAAKKGELPTRGGYVHMFVSPWDNRYIGPMKTAFGQVLAMTVHMSDCNSQTLACKNLPILTQEQPTAGSDAQVQLTETVTNSLAYKVGEQMPQRQKRIDFLNKIAGLYNKLNAPFTLLGFICYLLLTVRLLWQLFTKRKPAFEGWLIITGLALSYLIRLLLISYTDVSACYSNYYMYLAPCYWLLLAAVCLSVALTIQWAAQGVRSKNFRRFTAMAVAGIGSRIEK